MGNSNKNTQNNNQNVKVVVNVGDHTAPKKKRSAPKKKSQPAPELADVPLIATPAIEQPFRMSSAYGRPRPQPYAMPSQVNITNSSGAPIPSYFQAPYTNIEATLNSHRDAMRQQMDDLRNELASQATNAQHLVNIELAIKGLNGALNSELDHSVSNPTTPASGGGGTSMDTSSGGSGDTPPPSYHSYQNPVYGMDVSEQPAAMSMDTSHYPQIEAPQSSGDVQIVEQPPPTINTVASTSEGQSAVNNPPREDTDEADLSSLRKKIDKYSKNLTKINDIEASGTKLTYYQKQRRDKLERDIADYTSMYHELTSQGAGSAGSAVTPFNAPLGGSSVGSGSSKSSQTRR